MPILRRLVLHLLFLGSAGVAWAGESPADLVLRYPAPATRWEQEALPIGNGRLGAMLFGDPRHDRIQFNESTLWAGDEQDTGAYQAFGDILIDWEVPPTAAVTGYERRLDLAQALSTVAYQRDGIAHQAEAFASHPDQVLVFRYTADRPGALNGRIRLTDAHQGAITAVGNRLTATGTLAGVQIKTTRPYAIVLGYESQVLAVNEGGSVTAADGALVVAGATTLTLLVDAGTDFVQDAARGWRGAPPHERIVQHLAAASARPYAAMKADHTADYRRLFDRVTLDLGGAPAATVNLPTDQRLAQYAKAGGDPGLEALVFQYGRYLFISSSRAGGVPANLQGIWNSSTNPPWRCDYHSDVNLQMNYWLADAVNLGECFQPFSDYLASVEPVRTRETAAAFKCRGWTMKGENGLFGGASWNWLNAGSAWYCQNLWDHYAFTGDREYLRTRAYPLMRGVCAFWEDQLKPLPDGRLVAPKNFSPEQMSFLEEGVSFDQELVWELFTDAAESARILGVDPELQAKWLDLRSRLVLPKIGKWGQLQEWMTDRDDPKNTHRHTSHLVGLHPGRRITPRGTPELAAAARVSLNARGDVSTGWSTAWKINFWARLHDGDRARVLIGNLFRLVGDSKMNYSNGGGLYANLLDAHPPFQIDGNFGYTAGVAEMLVQSHAGEIELLPALPKGWPAGRVTGLRARGGYTVDLAWRDGRVATYRITAREPRDVAVRIGDAVTTVRAEAAP